MSGSYRSGCLLGCSVLKIRTNAVSSDPLKISLLLGRYALEPWSDVTGRKAIAHVPRAITWPPELGASSFHTRFNLGWKCDVGEHEGEEGEPKQRRHWPDPFLRGSLRAWGVAAKAPGLRPTKPSEGGSRAGSRWTGL
jgi:hypothetical protein